MIQTIFQGDSFPPPICTSKVHIKKHILLPFLCDPPGKSWIFPSSCVLLCDPILWDKHAATTQVID